MQGSSLRDRQKMGLAIMRADQVGLTERRIVTLCVSLTGAVAYFIGR